MYYVDSSRFPHPILHNTILAANVLGSAGSDSPNDISGTLDPASSHNLIGDAATAGGLVHGVNSNLVGNGTIGITTVLDPNLADKGSPTLTHALVSAGPALNAGDNTKAVDANGEPLVFDQRGEGFARIVASTAAMALSPIVAAAPPPHYTGRREPPPATASRS